MIDWLIHVVWKILELMVSVWILFIFFEWFFGEVLEGTRVNRATPASSEVTTGECRMPKKRTWMNVEIAFWLLVILSSGFDAVSSAIAGRWFSVHWFSVPFELAMGVFASWRIVVLLDAKNDDGFEQRKDR